MASTEVYHTLPRYLQRRIDRAFHSVSKDSHTGDGGGGGFIATPGGLSLSSIPKALQLVDLPPDDEEALQVFRNAATGWEGEQTDTGRVSLDDWRAVVGILLEPRAKEYGDSSDGDVDMDDGAESDEYQEPERDEDEDDEELGADDEYVEEALASSNRRRIRGRPRAGSDSPAPKTPKKLTARQKETCLQAYSLIFPDVQQTELSSQRIKIQDIQRVAKLIGEKLKAEEIVEMLETFSSSTDKTMNFDDFQRMMIAAELA